MDDMFVYEPPLSLWALVDQYVPDNERDEVKNMLGESLVDQSLELHLEVDTLLEIWRDFRDDSIKERSSERLPEPPAVRDRLRQEIMFFVENIREKAGKEGRDPNRVFARHNHDVLTYACDQSSTSSSDTWSRPTTARSSTGRETPMRCTPSSSSERMSSLSTVSDDVEAMHDKLNILHLDEITQHLRTYLEEEVQQLLRDIEFLQECLEREADFRDSAGSMTQREPTLTELREERQKLEKDLLEAARPSPPAIKKVPFRPSPEGLKTGTMKVRSPGTMSPTAPARPKPMKASHDVSTKVLEFPNQNQNIGQNVRNNNNCLDRTGNVPNIANAKLVKVTIPASRTGSAELSPVPPTSARPSSASRFRRMVLNCRDSP
ncbi:coiled-coil domain-containing protein 24-like [Lineus longissimus]|uniref:coiled-coil domain-containing protein 24-like n=1 Tax=Lineus longissimus TaxID=88925 RepID=UPI002B4EFFFC